MGENVAVEPVYILCNNSACTDVHDPTIIPI